MRQTIKLNTDNLKIIRKVNERMMSYNIEMAEVTGGTFWKEYTPEQITGKAKVPAVTIGKEYFTTMREVMQYYSPADLRKKLLIKLENGSGRRGCVFTGRGRPRHITILMG